MNKCLLQDERSIVWQFCRFIIDPYYERNATTSQLPVPVPLRIALYSLCALLVQRCSHHIHEAKQKENGVSGQFEVCYC